ncbi:hypothetical protein E1L24_23315 [Salmonella enterica subsp. enterica serovar Braenderup]|nr:hypothetical protein [Salmonella enterica subsp. enterica serovar Braenderup]
MSILIYNFRCWLDTKFKTWACGENVRTIVKATDWYTEIVVLPDGQLINVQVRNISVRIGRKGGAIFLPELYLVSALELKAGPMLFDCTAQHYFDTLIELGNRVKKLGETVHRFIKETERTTVEI